MSSPIGNRPLGEKDANGYLIERTFNDMAFQGDYTGTNLIYGGFARPGASTSALVWQIFKCTYDGSNNILTRTWPQTTAGIASNDFQFQWTNRAAYTYS